MANTLGKALLGFLSFAVFIATFVLIGDVLISAVAAVAVAFAQFVLWRTASISPGPAIWASLAVVITLTGLSLSGDDNFALNPGQMDAAQQDCQCTAKQKIPARATPVPSYEVPKVVSAPGGV